MSWTLLIGIAATLLIALCAAVARRIELARMQRALAGRERAVRNGAAVADLQHPVIDLSRCLGCATCVAVCPEEDVLDIVHGQAFVKNGASCQGVAACERECPVGAIELTIGDLSQRDDVPVLSEELEAIGTPGLFLAGEVTAQARIASAIDQGTAVAAEVARRLDEGSDGGPFALDLVIVGAGPAGLAASLEAKRHGLSFVTLDREGDVGGTVARYPREKLVLTRPLRLPLVGRFGGTTWRKEDLVRIWRQIAHRHKLPIRGGELLEQVETGEHGGFVVHTQEATYAARHVCIAIGRRGNPRRLGVPGEELAKVLYGLNDARDHRERHVLVVGGGDAAVETALGLAEEPTNRVTLSYRREEFFRLRPRNQERVEAARAARDLEVLFRSEVLEITDGAVELSVQNGGGHEPLRIENDEVFVLAGGEPPKALLERSGVSHDPSAHAPAAAPEERGSGLIPALAAGCLLTLAALCFALWHSDYYLLPRVERAADLKHDVLRPGNGLGFWFGIAACALVAVNLAYLLRRWPRFGIRIGSLKAWMTSHVATGILAFLCATLHAGMAPRDTPGGHAWLALAALLVTGAIGRYFYAWVPRAANGRELELAEVKARLAEAPEGGNERECRFRERAFETVSKLVTRRQWRGSVLGRALALFGVQRDLQRVLRGLRTEGRRAGVSNFELRRSLALARRAHRTALSAAHFEDLRALLGGWRFFHRWVALLMVLLVAVHVFLALTYRAIPVGGGGT